MKDFQAKKSISCALILVDDPYSSFTTLLEHYHKLISFQKTGIEQPSFISPTAKIGQNVYIGAFAYIGEHAVIGNNVKIYRVKRPEKVKVSDLSSLLREHIVHPYSRLR